MIKVSYIEKNNIIEKISIKGHSGYDEFGKDIVCAAVSATVLNTLNNINIINEEVLNHSEKDGEVLIIVIKEINEKSIINRILINLINELKEIEKNYSKYIDIRRC